MGQFRVTIVVNDSAVLLSQGPDHAHGGAGMAHVLARTVWFLMSDHHPPTPIVQQLTRVIEQDWQRNILDSMLHGEHLTMFNRRLPVPDTLFGIGTFTLFQAGK